MLLSRYVGRDIAHMRTASLLCVCVQSNLHDMIVNSSCSKVLGDAVAYQACIQ